MKKIKVENYEFYIGDWQDGKASNEVFVVTVAKNTHVYTDYYVYMEDAKQSKEKVSRICTRAKAVADYIKKYDFDVLIHCAAGMSRSVCFAALVAYELLEQRRTLQEARDLVESQYPQADVLSALWDSINERFK